MGRMGRGDEAGMGEGLKRLEEVMDKEAIRFFHERKRLEVTAAPISTPELQTT